MLKKDVLLKNYTIFKIGGPAKYFFVARTKENLVSAIKKARENNWPCFVLGGGSNVLVSDKGFKGLVIKIQNTKYKIQDTEIVAEAGVFLGTLINVATKLSLTGLEWAAGIPGTLGGAVFGNAGAFGQSMKDIVREVELFDTKVGKIKVFKNKDCKFSYRESIFKKNKNLIIISLILKMKKGRKKEIQKKIKKYLAYKKETQPLSYASAGSVFKNPPGKSAGELIEKAGLKGKTIGGAQISKKHANFIINKGKAKAEDVKKLISLVKKTVKKKFGTSLEEEIVVL